MNENELYKRFVTTNKSLIIAPAGYGKTHALAESLKHVANKHLVLTHTHAGVAALKEKVNLLGVPKANFHIETISSFAQKYTTSFNFGDIPEQKNSEVYYPFILEKATRLFGMKNIQDILRINYSGLFVDEYQDCTLQQHKMLMTLSETLPIHILGDPMQGIFGFRGQTLVDFEKDLNDFSIVGNLEIPWRWNAINQKLGVSMHEARIQLEKGSIALSCFNGSAEILIVENADDITTTETEYNKLIWKHLDTEENLLLIYPDSANIHVRTRLCARFKRRFSVVEAIDDKSFYDFAAKFDALMGSQKVYEELTKYIKGTRVRGRSTRSNTLLTGLNDFLKDDKPPQRPRTHERIEATVLLNEVLEDFNFSRLSNLLKSLKRLTGVNYLRKELFWDLVNALAIADQENTTVTAAMEGIRNRKRSSGKRIYGKSIGTTLLTKGLEFETVIVLNAHEFTDAKNLYVALTRATKRLIIASEKTYLEFS